MNLKAIVTALVLSSSTVALAAPAYNHGPAPFAPEIRDHRMPQRPIASWKQLGTGELVRGKDTIKLYNANKIDKLKLEVARGMLFVDKIVVTYGNGRTQTLEVDKWVSLRNDAIVDLRGSNRKITSVTVHGRGNGFRAGGSFKLLAL
jgi:hypothetical protein